MFKIFFYTFVLISACKTPSANRELNGLASDNTNKVNELIEVWRVLKSHPSEKIKVAQGNFENKRLQQTLNRLNELLEDIFEDRAASVDFAKAFVERCPHDLQYFLYSIPSLKVDDKDGDNPGSSIWFSSWNILEEGGSTIRTLAGKGTPTEVFNSTLAKESLTKLLSLDSKSTTYDGVNGTHDFADPEAELAAAYVASSLIFNFTQWRQIVRDLPAETADRLFRKSNTIDTKSRSEVYDFLFVSLKRQIGSLIDKSYSYNSPLIGNLAESILDYALTGIALSKQNSVLLLQNSVLDTLPSFICANPDNSDATFLPKGRTDPIGFEPYGVLSILSFSKLADVTKTNQSVNGLITCGQHIYQVAIEKAEGLRIPYPQIKRNGDIHALASIDLVRESSISTIVGGLAYIMANGYLPLRISHIENTKDDFMRIAKDPLLNRIILPVGHLFTDRAVGLGSQRSVKIEAMRRVSGRRIILSIYMPPLSSDSNAQKIEYTDMKEILCSGKNCEVLQADSGGVSVLTTSCFSSATIEAWMSALIDSQKDTQTFIPTPLVVASKKGFDTSNPFMIISHVDYILRFLELSAMGETPENITKQLTLPIPNTLPRSLLRRVNEFYFGSDIKFNDTFSPVCNIDQKAYFEGHVSTIKLRPL